MKKHKNVKTIKNNVENIQVHLNASLMCKNPNKLDKSLRKLLAKHGCYRAKGYMSDQGENVLPATDRQQVIELKSLQNDIKAETSKIAKLIKEATNLARIIEENKEVVEEVDKAVEERPSLAH